MNNAFKEYSTGIAFGIQLSKNQCNILLRLNSNASTLENLWLLQVGQLTPLAARGLVYWNYSADGEAQGFQGLTKAGKLLAELLQEAGMTVESTNSVSMIRRLERDKQSELTKE